ncbi:unnamed protein product, partial [Allacma fusca]
ALVQEHLTNVWQTPGNINTFLTSEEFLKEFTGIVDFRLQNFYLKNDFHVSEFLHMCYVVIRLFKSNNIYETFNVSSGQLIDRALNQLLLKTKSKEWNIVEILTRSEAETLFKEFRLAGFTQRWESSWVTKLANVFDILTDMPDDLEGNHNDPAAIQNENRAIPHRFHDVIDHPQEILKRSHVIQTNHFGIICNPLDVEVELHGRELPNELHGSQNEPENIRNVPHDIRDELHVNKYDSHAIRHALHGIQMNHQHIPNELHGIQNDPQDISEELRNMQQEPNEMLHGSHKVQSHYEMQDQTQGIPSEPDGIHNKYETMQNQLQDILDNSQGTPDQPEVKQIKPKVTKKKHEVKPQQSEVIDAQSNASNDQPQNFQNELAVQQDQHDITVDYTRDEIQVISLADIPEQPNDIQLEVINNTVESRNIEHSRPRRYKKKSCCDCI